MPKVSKNTSKTPLAVPKSLCPDCGWPKKPQAKRCPLCAWKRQQAGLDQQRWKTVDTAPDKQRRRLLESMTHLTD